MLFRYTGLFVFGLVAAASACAPSAKEQQGCQTRADCDAGYVCEQSQCIKLCLTQAGCGDGLICTIDGVCRIPQEGDPPTIESIVGNAPDNTARIKNGISVTGTGFAEAVFELRDESGAIPLTVESQSSQTAELLFPADVHAGTYSLVATNQAGSGESGVTLTLPDITGQMVIDKINAPETSGTIKASRLPVGDEAETVAPGDHLHDERYLKPEDATSQFLDATGTENMEGNLEVTGTVGIQRSAPNHPLEVGGDGYTYVKTSASSAQNTPRCDCDNSEKEADCGAPEDVQEIYEFSEHDGGICFDHWDIENVTGATKFEEQPGEPPLPGLVVTDTGNLGIGIEPSSRLSVYTPGASGSQIDIGGHTLTLRGVNDTSAYNPRLPYIEWLAGEKKADGEFPRAMYLGWGHTGETGRYVDMKLENEYDLAIRGGNVGIGTASPSHALHVSGDIAHEGSVISVSDARLKKNVRGIDNPLRVIEALRGVRYERTDEASDATQIGVIAQEVETVLPELVQELDPKSGTKGVNYIGLIPVLIEALKQQQATIDSLSETREVLETRLKSLEARAP